MGVIRVGLLIHTRSLQGHRIPTCLVGEGRFADDCPLLVRVDLLLVICEEEALLYLSVIRGELVRTEVRLEDGSPACHLPELLRSTLQLIPTVFHESRADLVHSFI